LKKIYFSSHKLAKQQLINFWSQEILGINIVSIFCHMCRCHLSCVGMSSEEKGGLFII
jgi:hypothetical protein